MSALSVENCSVQLGTRKALDGVSLEIQPGEIVALLGPNGSGKSTLIRAIAGLVETVQGTIKVGVDDIKRLKARQIAQRIAVVPQDEQIVFDFSVREIVTMGRLPQSTGIFDTQEERDAAEEAMKIADCSELADRPITQLSGGEKQRVLIARALAQGTSVILLDEPTAHLDASHQADVVRVVRSLASNGKAVLVALHDLNVASHIANRALLLDRGRAAMSGTVHEVLLSPTLEAVYGVEFARFESGSVVVPRLVK